MFCWCSKCRCPKIHCKEIILCWTCFVLVLRSFLTLHDYTSLNVSLLPPVSHSQCSVILHHNQMVLLLFHKVIVLTAHSNILFITQIYDLFQQPFFVYRAIYWNSQGVWCIWILLYIKMLLPLETSLQCFMGVVLIDKPHSGLILMSQRLRNLKTPLQELKQPIRFQGLHNKHWCRAGVLSFCKLEFQGIQSWAKCDKLVFLCIYALATGNLL